MNILILGATGFIGNSIFCSLVSKQSVFIAGRQPIEGYKNWKYLDFTKQTNWNDIIENIDMVINAIGILEGDFTNVQTEGPLKFYADCIRKNIKIIHISAVGAEKENLEIEFLKSKKRTDDFLLKYKNAKVIYPGIVIGKNGKSSQFFKELSSLSIIPIPKKVNPPLVHIYQLTELIENIVDNFEKFPQQIFAVSCPEKFSDLLVALNKKKRIIISMPYPILKLFFRIFPKTKIGIFSKDMLAMVSEISAETYWNHSQNYHLLDLKNPIFLEPTTKYINSENMIESESFSYILGLLSISYIWIWSALSSIISWNESYALMQEVGANHLLSVFSIYLGTFVDLILGFSVFSKKYRHQVLLIQILIVTTYTIILTIFAPHYWLHPFGVVAKNIPLLALSYYILRAKL